MSLARDIQLQGWGAQALVSADTFVVLATTAAQFDGILDPQPGIDPRLELGSDIRELAVIQVLNEDLPQQVVSQIRIQQITAPGRPIWRVIRRDFNPGDITTKIWVVRVVAGVDS